MGAEKTMKIGMQIESAAELACEFIQHVSLDKHPELDRQLLVELNEQVVNAEKT